jgi:DNA repair exonuclease SbcCD ATPase subunit
MRILSVEAKNFRSYKELDWKLPESGLYLIDGENMDTGRNNMTGKTTLVDSIFWALYGWLPKWGGTKGGPVDGVIKRGESRCTVQVNLEFSGKKIFIRRERPNKLVVEIDGVEVHGKTAELDNQIPDLIGMTAEQFLTAVYISQDRKQSFFSMNEGDRTILLSQISKVEDINKAMEKAKKLKSETELAIEKQLSVIETVKSQIESTPKYTIVYTDAITTLEQRFTEQESNYNQSLTESENQINILKENEEASLRDITTIYEHEKARSTIYLKEQEAQVAIIEAEIMQAPRLEFKVTQKIEELKKALINARENNSNLVMAKGKNIQAKTALLNIANEIESISEGKCDHCSQELPQHMRDEHIQKLLHNAKKWEAMITEEGQHIPESPIEIQLNEAMQEYHKNKAELEAAPKQKQSELNALVLGIDLTKRQLYSIEKNYQYDTRSSKELHAHRQHKCSERPAELKQLMRNTLHEIETNKKALANIQLQLDDQILKLSEAESKHKVLGKQLDEALDLIDLFKGFRQVCFEDLIARISDRAGFLLSLMTDGIYSTRIDQMGETSKGEAKLILKPMITKGGQDVPMDDLSGGARRTVMLAYDVAVAEAVGDSNVLFLDEALDGLDTMGKAEALKLLEEVARNKAVMVIDHSSEIKSAFSEIIKVVYRDGNSSLESNGTESFEPSEAQN